MRYLCEKFVEQASETFFPRTHPAVLQSQRHEEGESATDISVSRGGKGEDKARG